LKKFFIIYSVLTLSSALFSVHALAAESDFYQDILAEVSTPIKSDITNRTDNIILACELINETVIAPGSAFSFNKVVGNRTEERGFKPAPTFIDGRVGSSVGGGICQVSSTLYYACLLSDLKIVSRSSHSMSPDYIEKPGLDAMISWNAIDYKFINNTKNPIKIFTWVENKSVYVKISGTKMTDNSVIIESNILSTTPFRTIFRDNPNLSPGQTRVVQIPFTGYVVETYRVIMNPSGEVVSRMLEAKNSYKKLDEIIERSPQNNPDKQSR
jgi:vancomycin resistance protein YoaR